MPDPHVLYVVTAVVVFGLVVWVGVVLSLSEKSDSRADGEGKSPPEPTTVGDVARKEGPTGPTGAL
jgi:hypothetical protein